MKRKRTGTRRRQARKPPKQRIRSIRVVLTVVLVGLGTLAWFLFSERTKHKGVPADAEAASNPSLLLITLDTTRADRIGCYGYQAAGTPTIDGLAQSGIRFEHAYTQVPLTLPSHTSLLTGLYPVSTGVRINGSVALGKEVATLATQFKDRGYRTAAFIGSSVLDSAFGLARGFDLYDDRIQSGAEEHEQVQRSADNVCDAALRWLNGRTETAFFAWVHFFDAHTPYQPPPEFASRFDHPYDAEIAFVDTQIRRLLDWLEAQGLRDRTLVVLAGDHGEGLEEHREAEHGFFIYNATMHVPLVLSQPVWLPEPRVITTPARLVDVLPTIAELFGWEMPGDLDGRSLAPACRGDTEEALPVYGESEYPWLSFGWAPLQSLMVDQWKYIDAPKPELYDLGSDPGELTNLIQQHPDRAGRLKGALQDLIAGMKVREASTVAPDASALDKLASLGYVAGAGSEEDPTPDQALRDPKDMFGIFEGFTRALGLVKSHRFAEAAGILEQATRISPESDEMFSILGTAYLRLNRFEEAQSAFETSLRKTGANPRRLTGLGEALRSLNRLDDAVLCFQQALALAPEWGPAHRGLAAAYARMKRYAEAEPHWRACLEQNPSYAYCLTNLGSTLLVLGRPSEAVPVLERALRQEPTNEFAYRSLWQALVATGRRAEAIKRLKAGVASLPEAKSLTCPLARLLATTTRTSPGDLDRAAQWAEACCQAQPNNPRYLDTLAAVRAAGNDFVRAAETAREALSAAQAGGRLDVARQIESHLRLYEAGKRLIE